MQVPEGQEQLALWRIVMLFELHNIDADSLVMVGQAITTDYKRLLRDLLHHCLESYCITLLQVPW